jgi:hypothetical protein
MLAEEEFSDRPRCVCPVIGGFLRGFNDRLAHFDRQFLLPYAELIVGSRAGRRLTRERRRICMDWVTDAPPRLFPRLLARLRVRARITLRCGPRALLRVSDGIGDHAALVAIAGGDAEAGFELLERLLDTVPWLERQEPERADAPAETDPTAMEPPAAPAPVARRRTIRTDRFRPVPAEAGEYVVERVPA